LTTPGALENVLEVAVLHPAVAAAPTIKAATTTGLTLR